MSSYDEASKELENLIASPPRLPVGYRNFSPYPSLLDPLIDQKASLVNPTLSESEFCESILDQRLGVKLVDLNPPSINCTFSVESEPHTDQVLLVSSISNELEVKLHILEVHKRISLVPIEQEVKSHVPMTPPLNS